METATNFGFTNLLKSEENETNVDNILNNITSSADRNFFSDIIDEIVKQKILLKLQKNVTLSVDGRVIYFSPFLRQLICNSRNINSRINLVFVEREYLVIILQFISILEFSTEKYMFDVKIEELNKWYKVNKPYLRKIEETAKYLKINHLFDFLSYKEKLKSKVQTFKTGIDMKRTTISLNQEDQEYQEEISETKNFQEAFPPKYDPGSLSLKMPIDTVVVKKNATKNFIQKGKFNAVLNDPNLNSLVDALISDSFWFVVCFFQISNIYEKNKVDELKKKVSEILRRVSTNYFKFFINLCDDDCVIKKKDPVLNMFRDFMAQCVFFSLYLAFPKSREIFNDEFRNKIISLFSYLYNGLNTQNNYSNNNWDLDLGKGNIIESGNYTLNSKNNKDKQVFKLPEISDFHQLIKNNLKNQEYIRKNKSASDNKKKNTVTTTILNTPLYRLYAENNRFETLNMIKPINFSQRKVVDIEHKTKQDSEFLEVIKDYSKLMMKRKKNYLDTVSENEKAFNDRMREVKQNSKRLKKEFMDIRTQRYQEYANYCIFISSK